MSRWARAGQGEKGVALPLALFVLVALSALTLAFVSVGGMEPHVSRNLSDASQARYAAESGIEWAYDQLVSVPSFTTLLQSKPVVGSNPQAAWLTPVDANGNPVAVTLPGLTANIATYTVQIRNDVLPDDRVLTGVTPDTALTTDDNGVLIVTATGTYNGLTRQIQVVIRRLRLPPLAGAFSMPGIQADLWFQNANFTIDGRDYVSKCAANCTDPNPLSRTYTHSLNTDQSNMKYGIATSFGSQPTLSPPQTLEQRAEFTLDTARKQAQVMGKSQVGGGFTTGLNTVAPDDSLGAFVTVPDGTTDPPRTPKVLNDFMSRLAQFSETQIYQSTLACAVDMGGTPVGIQMIANPDPSKANLVTLKNNCGLNRQVDLGTVDHPALLYFRGDLDPTGAFAGVRTDGTGNQKIKGAGILIVEDGDFRINSEFEWDGIVISTGRYVSLIFEPGAKVNIYGAAVANETKSCEGGCSNFAANEPTQLYYSRQNLDMVQRALLFRMSTWREL